MELEVEITRLGARGDGVAEGPDGPIFVPFTLPGERVKVAVDGENDHARLVDVLEPSPRRPAPVCRHFGVCGGCALQHMDAQFYLRWKREQVVAALRSRGLEAEVEEVIPVPLGSRRRASLAIARGAMGLALGYQRARSHELIDIAVCPGLSPRIVEGLPKLRKALVRLLRGKREAKVGITETDNGLDVVVEGVNPAPPAIAAFATQAPALGVSRLTIDGESLTTCATPEVEPPRSMPSKRMGPRLPHSPRLRAKRRSSSLSGPSPATCSAPH